MGWTNIDDFIAEVTGGKFQKGIFQKVSSNGATSAAGRWHEWFTATGIPAAGTLAGTAGVATVMDASTTGAMDVGGNVSTDTKHLLSVQAFTSSSSVIPALAVLVDCLLYYPSLVVTGTPTTLDNTATLTRYTTGAGVMAIISVQTALGAASPALTFTYTDQAGNTGHTANAHTSPVNSAPVSTLFARSGQPFITMAAGDTGIRKLESYTLASGTTGTVAAMLVKPLTSIPLLGTNTAAERDLLFQIPSLPRVVDGACLAWLTLVGSSMGVSSTLGGFVDVGWG